MNVMLSKTFFPQHRKAGQPTGFREKVLNGGKRHTCRCNYEFWKKRIKQLQKRKGVLSIRQWSGKPYAEGSTQELVLDVPASMVEVQRLVMTRSREKHEVFEEGHPETPYATGTTYTYRALVDGTPVDVVELAKNDGLSLDDFMGWFNPVFDKQEKRIEIVKDGKVIEPEETTLLFAVIQFSTFRY